MSTEAEQWITDASDRQGKPGYMEVSCQMLRHQETILGTHVLKPSIHQIFSTSDTDLVNVVSKHSTNIINPHCRIASVFYIIVKENDFCLHILRFASAFFTTKTTHE